MNILRRRQEQFLAYSQIDRTHPLSIGLVGLWRGINGNPNNNGLGNAPELLRGYANDILGTVGGGNGGRGRFTAAGMALAGDPVSDFGGRFISAGVPSTELKPTDRVSIVWYGVIEANTAANDPCIASLDGDTGGPTYGMRRVNNTDVQFIYYNGGFSLNTATNVISNAEYERPMMLSATFGSSALKGYKNGIEILSAGGVSGLIYNASNARVVLDHNSFWGTRAHVATAIFLIYNRELSPTEHMALAINPFQMFIHQSPQWLFSNKVAASPSRGAKGGGNKGGKGGGGRNQYSPTGALLVNIGNPGVDL